LIGVTVNLSADAAYKVVLKSGTVIEAKSKPASIEGCFRFTSLDNKFYALPVEQVNLQATEQVNAANLFKTTGGKPTTRRFTNENLPAGKDLFPESSGPVKTTGDTDSQQPAKGARDSSHAGGTLTPSSGVEKYDQALQEHLRTGKPMALYFYVDWCPYCTELDKEILASPEVRQYLDRILYIPINAEAGEQEKALFKQLGGTGYPHFLVVSKGSNQLQKIRTYTQVQDQWVLLTPTAFVNACRNAGG
jgi:thiol-disulfide isomerase/thioredoxin